MNVVFLLVSVLLLSACNAYTPYDMQYGAGYSGSKNQYVPVIVSDNGNYRSLPAVKLCTRGP